MDVGMVGNGQRAHSECMLCQAASHIYLISCQIHHSNNLSGGSSTSWATSAIQNQAADHPHQQSRQAQSQSPASPSRLVFGVRRLPFASTPPPAYATCPEGSSVPIFIIWSAPHHSASFGLPLAPLRQRLIATKFAQWLVVWPTSPCSAYPIITLVRV